MRMLRVFMPLLLVSAALTSVAAAPVDKAISVDLRDADLRQVIDGIMRGAGANYVVADRLEGKVTAYLENVPLDEALKVILGATGYLAEEGEQGYIIRKDPDAKPPAPPAPRGPRLAAPPAATARQTAAPQASAPAQPETAVQPAEPAQPAGPQLAPNQQGAMQMPPQGWQGQPMYGYPQMGYVYPQMGYAYPQMGYYAPQPYVAPQPQRPYPAMSAGWGMMGGGFGRMMPLGQSAFTPLGGWGNSTFTPLGGNGGAFTPLGW